jgi:hypothetical protein
MGGREVDALNEDRHTCIAAAMDSYLSKPITAQQRAAIDRLRSAMKGRFVEGPYD